MAVIYQDYYAALGVWHDAKPVDIEKAYARLSQKYDPTVNSSWESRDKFMRVRESYEVLRDPRRRKRYDALGDDWKHGQPFTPPGWDDLVAELGDEAALTQSTRSGEEGFSEFFALIFGKNSPFESKNGPDFLSAGDPKRVRPGENLEVTLNITLQELYEQISKRITVLTLRDGFKTLQINIPCGVTDGSVLRLTGHGVKGADGGKSGDLLVKLSVTPDSRFRLEEFDVVMPLYMTPWDAVLGSKVSLDTLDSSVSVSVPPGTQYGQRLRLRGKGLKKENGERGDILAEVAILVPKEPTEEEKALFLKLKSVSQFKAVAPALSKKDPKN